MYNSCLCVYEWRKERDGPVSTTALQTMPGAGRLRLRKPEEENETAAAVNLLVLHKLGR